MKRAATIAASSGNVFADLGDEHAPETLLKSRLAQRLANRRGHFMPTSLLESQLATLEAPAADETVWVCDISQPLDLLVTMLVERVASA